MSVWHGEVEKAEKFVLVQIASSENSVEEHDIEFLRYLSRPKVTEVLEDLNEFTSWDL